MLVYSIPHTFVSSDLLSHPVLGLVDVAFPVADRVQAVIRVVSGTRQLVAEFAGPAEWTALLEQVRRLPDLPVARLV